MSIELTTATNAERQNIVDALFLDSVALKLTDFTATTPPANSIGQVGGELRVGNGAATGGKSVGGITPTIVLDTGGVVFFLGTPAGIENSQFSGDTSLTQLLLGNSVTSIGNSAFNNCSGFTGSLTIPSSVTSIGNSAFQDCSGFTGTLTIPSSVTSIGDNAFDGCTGFTGSLTIPNSVTTIGSDAFNGCSAITNVQCRVTKTILDAATNAFLGSGITTINARTSDGTWTAGAGQTIAGKSGITVTKDLV